MSNKNGFTLIELMVVIALIGIFASIVLASTSSARAKARDAQRLSDMKQIETALNMYASEHNGAFPDPTYSADGSLAGWEVSNLSNFMEYLNPYMHGKTPVDPRNKGFPIGFMFQPRPDAYFYNYYYYNFPTAGEYYGCSFSGPLAVIGFRSAEILDPKNLPKAQCGPQPCPDGGIPNVCRDWSTEFDYSVIVKY